VVATDDRVAPCGLSAPGGVLQDTIPGSEPGIRTVLISDCAVSVSDEFRNRLLTKVLRERYAVPLVKKP
jgi:hypothetical protein